MNDIYIAFPITAGMDCLLIVSEQELDAWIGGGESENDIRFDLTSAIAIPGLLNKGSAALREACNKESIILQNGDSKLSINKENVEIKGNLIVSGDVKAKNVSLINHTHTGVHGDTCLVEYAVLPYFDRQSLTGIEQAFQSYFQFVYAVSAILLFQNFPIKKVYHLLETQAL